MTKEELIAAIRIMTDYQGVRLKDIEETLKMPQNSLSGMLNGSRPLSPKWQVLLIAYVQAKNKRRKTIVIPMTPTPSKAPPPGLTKAQQLRWLREHNQTLQ